MVEINQIRAKEAPLPLLLQADPCELKIKEYLIDSWCYGIFENHILVGICVAKIKEEDVAEVFNIAVARNQQGKTYGSQLLTFVLKDLQKKSLSEVVVGTGTFGYQLTFYQRLGFRVDRIEKNYFIEQYEEPIFEKGVQHKDRLILSYLTSKSVRKNKR